MQQFTSECKLQIGCMGIRNFSYANAAGICEVKRNEMRSWYTYFSMDITCPDPPIVNFPNTDKEGRQEESN
jgi:hypothetical protein